MKFHEFKKRIIEQLCKTHKPARRIKFKILSAHYGDVVVPVVDGRGVVVSHPSMLKYMLHPNRELKKRMSKGATRRRPTPREREMI